MTFSFLLLGIFSLNLSKISLSGGGATVGFLTRGRTKMEIKDFCFASKQVKCVGGERVLFYLVKDVFGHKN